MLKFLLTLTLLSLQLSAFALPAGQKMLQQMDPFFGSSNYQGILESLSDDYDFEGIVKLNNCSASVIKFKGDNNPNRKALMLTNGHCMGIGSVRVGFSRMPDMGEIFVNYRKRRSVELFKHAATVVGRVNTTKIVYGTMTDSDFALYELDKSYRQIKAKWDIDPLILSDRRTTEGEPIEVISGYWKRGYSCNVDTFIHMLKEGRWEWLDSIRYTQPGCETIGGTSGSPIVHTITREVIGVNNTGNEGNEACSVMNPCEIDEDGNVTSVDGASYGQQTYWLYSCLDNQFQLDLDIAGCRLRK